MAESIRADVWTWAVRIYKSRATASGACKAGHVAVNGTKVKASHQVKMGDRVEALTPAGPKIYVVTRLIAKRVGATVAAGCFDDHSPPPLPRAERPAVVAQRDPGAGRPTKRDRRQIEAFRRQGDSHGNR